MLRFTAALTCLAFLLAGCNNDIGNGPEQVRPGERVALKLADDLKFVAGDSLQLAVAFEAIDEQGESRTLPCDHGKMLGDRQVYARVQFYDETQTRLDYENVVLSNHWGVVRGLVQVPSKAVQFDVHIEVEEGKPGIPIAPLDMREFPLEGDLSRYQLISR